MTVYSQLVLSSIGLDHGRQINKRTTLQWFNEALVRCVGVGGLDLFRDLFTPLFFNEHWLAANRANFFKSRSYISIGRQSGHSNLLVHAKATNWDPPYEQLNLPTLAITGWQDHIFFDAGDVEVLYARLPRAQRLDMPDAGHLIPVERFDALVFLNQALPAPQILAIIVICPCW